MKHLFKAQKLGWAQEQEIVEFDADAYSKEEATEQFKPYQDFNQKGYPYTGYEKDDTKYHHFSYLGTYEDNDLPDFSNEKRFLGNIEWYCDECNDRLDFQIGFNDHNLTWTCTKCGHINNISADEIIWE